MLRTSKNIVSVLFSFFRLRLLKMAYFRNIHFTWIERLSPSVSIDLDRKSKLIFGDRVSIHSGTRISAVEGGSISFGNHCFVNRNCIIASRERIVIGDGVAIGPNVMIYDHDHKMTPSVPIKESGYKLAAVEIGSDTWIGAGVIILAGTKIGNHCTVGAGSVVKQEVPDHTVLIQRRENQYYHDER